MYYVIPSCYTATLVGYETKMRK